MCITDTIIEQKKIGITAFLTSKNIFITGGTGYLGKALIEKLLRSCPDVNKIYLLIRGKRGKGLKERMKELCSDKVFDRLKRERDDYILEQKLIALAGDMTELNLGLSASDRNLLTKNIHIIFHAAATVRFDETLKKSVILNVRGTREVCQLALDAVNLEALIHVSTAYANCDKFLVSELLYPAKACWEKTIHIAETADEYTLATVTEKYIAGLPNTYCFTKQLAEHVINEMCSGKIKCAIVRPSIVVGAMKEPYAGWMDNFNGPLSLLIAFGKGIMRTAYTQPHIRPDYIPVDVVTKSLIVASWGIASRNIYQPMIFHCTSNNADWIRVPSKELASKYVEIMPELPFNDVVWKPNPQLTTNVVEFYMKTMISMLLPSAVGDMWLKILGKKPRLLRLQKRIYTAQLALRHFITHEWTYSNSNLLQLQETIPFEDKDIWDFEYQCYDFGQYLKDCILGARRFLLNEPDETLPNAKKHMRNMYWIDFVVKIIFYISVVIILWQNFF